MRAHPIVFCLLAVLGGSGQTTEPSPPTSNTDRDTPAGPREKALELVVQTFVADPEDVSGSMAVAISGDGELVLAGTVTPVLWKATTGEKLHTFEGHALVRAVSLSADGKLALTSGFEDTAILWKTVDGKPLHTFRGKRLSTAALSADGKLVVVGFDDGRTVLWRTTDGRKLHTIVAFKDPDRNPRVRSVGISGDGQLVVTGDGWGTAVLWDDVAAPTSLT